MYRSGPLFEERVHVHVVKFRREFDDLLSVRVRLLGEPLPLFDMERIEPFEIVPEGLFYLPLQFLEGGCEMGLQRMEHARVHAGPFVPALKRREEPLPVEEHGRHRAKEHAGLARKGDEITVPVRGVEARPVVMGDETAMEVQVLVDGVREELETETLSINLSHCLSIFLFCSTLMNFESSSIS